MQHQFSTISVKPKHCLLHITNILLNQQRKPKNNIVFFCKTHYIQCLLFLRGTQNNYSSDIIRPILLQQNKDIWKLLIRSILFRSHCYRRWLRSSVNVVNSKTPQESIQKSYIAVSVKCFTKPLSTPLASLPAASKEGIQSF